MSAAGTLISIATFAGIYALLTLGLNIKFGTTGILDFGHVAYFLVGAYVTALILVPPQSEQPTQDYILGLDLNNRIIDAFTSITGVELALLDGVAWAIAIFIAMVAAAFLGLVVALPAIRLRADYLAIALLGVSVILLRVVQNPPGGVTLVNGPDTLRGFSRPFNDIVPLPGDDLSSAILLGLLVFVVWMLLLWLLARESTIEARDARSTRIIRGLLWVTTLGGGYWAVNRFHTQRDSDPTTPLGPQLFPSRYRPLVVVTLGLGLLATVLSLVGLGEIAVLLLLGAASLASWVVAYVKIRNHYDGYTRRSAYAGAVLTLGLFVALLPVYVLGWREDIIAYAASFVTFGLLVVVGWVFFNLEEHLERFEVPGDTFGIVGITTIFILATRYFLISLVGANTELDLVESILQNFLWLVELDLTSGASLNYRRFLLIMILVSVAASFVFLQLVMQSPHGRVLKAVRDDENVAMALGKNSFVYKIQAMVVGSAIAGLAGALFAIQYRALSYNQFNPDITFFVFLAVILGGKGNYKGVILGAGLYWLFVRGTVQFAAIFPSGIEARITILRNAIIGLLLIWLLYFRPSGIWKESPPKIQVTDT